MMTRAWGIKDIDIIRRALGTNQYLRDSLFWDVILKESDH
jgi:hypothetical protein